MPDKNDKINKSFRKPLTKIRIANCLIQASMGGRLAKELKRRRGDCSLKSSSC